MTRRSDLLERLEAINPVPDASRIYDELEAADRLAGARIARDLPAIRDDELDGLAHGTGRARRRPGLVAAAAAAVVALIAGAGLLVGGETVPDVGSGERTLDVLFEGTAEDATCTIRGPSTVTAGVIEIIFRNESATAATDWMDFTRLDPGRTEQEIRDYVAAPFTNRPSWTSPVAQFDSVEQGVVSVNSEVDVGPGLYALVCGSNVSGQGILPEFGVVGGMLEVVPAP